MKKKNKKIEKKKAVKTKKKIVKKTPKKKVGVKKSAKKTVSKKAKPTKVKADKPVGKVIHYYNKIKVAVVKFKVPVKAGSKVSFRGATTNFLMTIDSMQYEHAHIKIAKKGQSLGLKVSKRVREGDQIYIEK
jgi:putative protease